MLNKLVLYSYAKLNLYLEVLHKRKDNYHNIKTIFERIDLCDKIILKVRRDKEINVTCNVPGVPQDSSNLTYRSAKLLQETFKVNKGVDIQILKRIPVGSGLGGGSSNAACVLTGLNKLWKLNLKSTKLVQLAKKLGSDVPFFVYNCAYALGTSRGDIIKPLRGLSHLRLWHILAVPRIRVSTASIYKKWDKYSQDSKLTPLDRHGILNKNSHLTGLTKPRHNVKIMTLALKKNNTSLLGEALFNSLEQITAKLYPWLMRLKTELNNMGVKSILMSGSGPAMFGVVSSKKEALSLYRQLKRKNLGEIFLTRTHQTTGGKVYGNN